MVLPLKSRIDLTASLPYTWKQPIWTPPSMTIGSPASIRTVAMGAGYSCMSNSPAANLANPPRSLGGTSRNWTSVKPSILRNSGATAWAAKQERGLLPIRMVLVSRGPSASSPPPPRPPSPEPQPGRRAAVAAATPALPATPRNVRRVIPRGPRYSAVMNRRRRVLAGRASRSTTCPAHRAQPPQPSCAAPSNEMLTVLHDPPGGSGLPPGLAELAAQRLR
jgi:hypothetical protein